MRTTSAILACLALAAGGMAQVQWTSLGPSPVNSPAMAASYDSLRDRVVVFSSMQTWEFDGLQWVRLQPLQAPFGSATNVMSFDPVRNRSVFYDGATWEWDGQNWMQQNAPGPQSRLSPAFAYNSRRGTVMLFGGVIPYTASFNDLWEWDGLAWRQIPATNPPPIGNQGGRVGLVYYDAMAYDADRDRLCVFGGVQTQQAQPGIQGLAVTWEWGAASGWSQINVAGPAILQRRMAYDESRRTTVVMGNDLVSIFGVWERTGTGPWVQRVTNPPWDGPILYDSLRARTLFLNTNASLWAYGPITPARYDFHGQGCLGSAGIPELRLAAPWTLPWLGDTLQVRIDRLPLSIAIMLTGFSDQTAGGLPLPFDLTPLGMPGCRLRVSPDATALVAGSQGSATFSLPIPNTIALRALRFFEQAVAFDPTGNAFGATLSDSAAAVVGGR